MTTKKLDIIDDVMKPRTTSKEKVNSPIDDTSTSIPNSPAVDSSTTTNVRQSKESSTSNLDSQAADSSTTTEKSKEYENWNTTPDDNIHDPRYFDDDALIEESTQEDVTQATIRNLLQPSKLLKKKIGEYIISKNLQNITIDEYTPFQTFIFEGQRYLLDHDVYVAYIQTMILDMSNHSIL